MFLLKRNDCYCYYYLLVLLKNVVKRENLFYRWRPVMYVSVCMHVCVCRHTHTTIYTHKCINERQHNDVYTRDGIWIHHKSWATTSPNSLIQSNRFNGITRTKKNIASVMTTAHPIYLFVMFMLCITSIVFLCVLHSLQQYNNFIILSWDTVLCAFG